MVTSTKVPDEKVVKMAEQNNSVVVPQRTLLGEVNEHITCPLCRGYYIDATTIVECLHSFCRSCIIKHLQIKSYCPVCEMMINSAKPNIKLDKALQDIVYKLVPGLFQKEMERRQQFYSSRPGPAATATPEQRGEDTERIIFSPEDVISFSLEYADATDTDSISSKSSDSNEPQLTTATSRRYLQCPAVVNISHLKKFLSMKFDIDNSQFAIDILYKRVPLPDYYTLMDIAYIYNWKRNEPMRFFYQIIDYIAIRNRLFDINRKGSHYQDRKPSPASTEDTNLSSPAPNLNDHGSEASSGTDSPMPGDNSSKQATDTCEKSEKSEVQLKTSGPQESGISNKICPSPKNEDVEKSQFLNSFELTAKSSSLSLKSSPTKSNGSETAVGTDSIIPQPKNLTPPKSEDILKRKHQALPGIHEIKKLKIEIEKTKLSHNSTIESTMSHNEFNDAASKLKESETLPKSFQIPHTSHFTSSTSSPMMLVIDSMQPTPIGKQPSEIPGAKRPGIQNVMSPKRKTIDPSNTIQPSPVKKTVSPVKQAPKQDILSLSVSKPSDVLKPTLKKIPDLKPSIPSTQNKLQTVNKVRMDLLANNSDPTIDRSKIMSQVKSSLSIQNTAHQTSGHPLKSLLDSCKINIPSSLSITLTDQKQEPHNAADLGNVDQKKNMLNKNLASATNSVGLKVPAPPVPNFIEILKLPDSDPKKQSKPDNSSENKSNTPNKTETMPQQKPNKSSESSAKGPVPNLKPIADTKLGKQSGNYGSPITFQQTFEQQLHSLQSDKKPKVTRNKAQVPKLVPATPKTFPAPGKLNSPTVQPSPSGIIPTIENKPSTALDLSTPHNIQSQLSPQQSKAFETMQSIANLAKKQNLPTKGIGQTLSQSFSGMSSRPLSTGPLRIPSAGNIPQVNLEKPSSNALLSNSVRQEIPLKTNSFKPSTNPSPTISSPHYQMSSLHSPTAAQPSPSSQTRSPSSSPKLVIAEEKQITNFSETNVNQSNQISSTQLNNVNVPKSESPKPSPGPSKPGLKPMKPVATSKTTGIRQPITPTIKTNPTPTDLQLITARQALLRHQMEVSAWLKAQRQFDVYRNIAHQSQNDFKDK